MKNGVQKRGRVQRKVMRAARAEEGFEYSEGERRREERRRKMQQREHLKEVAQPSHLYEPRTPVKRDLHRRYH